MEKILKKALSVKERLNESTIEVNKDDFKYCCQYLIDDLHALLRVMFATDERERDGVFRIYVVFSIPGTDRFNSIVLAAEGG